MEALKKRRGIFKTSMKKIITFADSAADATDTEGIRVRLDKAKDLYSEFIKVEDKMLILDEDAPSDMQEFEESYYSAISKLNQLLRPRPQHTTLTSDGNDSINNHSFSADVRLPRLNIPTFNGDYREWQSFHDLFAASVHDNTMLSAAQKFQYLKGLLKDEASSLLRHIPVTESNYLEAYHKLCKRYDKKRYIVNTFIKTFLDQPSMVTPTSVGLRKLSDTSDEVIRGLKALGENAERRDPWLIYIIVNKLDNDTRQQWSQQTAALEYPTIEELFEFLSKQSDALEGFKLPSKRVQPVKQTVGAFSTRGYVSTTNGSCPLCNTFKHPIYFCKKFQQMSVIQRTEFVNQQSFCFNCLSNNHVSQACTSQRSCRYCKERHHSLLHTTIADGNNVNTVSNTQPKFNQIPTSQTPSSSNTNNQAHSFLSSTKHQGNRFQSLLPTALIHIKDNWGNQQLCRALFDSGSQATFITEYCMQRLGLARTHARIKINGLAAAEAGFTRGTSTLELSPRTTSTPTITADALIVTKITSSLPPLQIETTNWEHLKYITLADPYFNTPSHIDVLIGSDLFFRLLEGQRI